MSKMEVLKSSYEDDKPQKGMRVGVIYDCYLPLYL